MIGKSKIEGKRIESGERTFQHPFRRVEEAQASHILMQGHARVLFEDAAEMIWRKMHGG